MTSGKRVSAEELTGAVEDYLKAIYAIERSEGPAATTLIAARLGVAPASVSAMVKRLADQGLAEHAPYQGVTLSDEGRRTTLRILRRHRIVESYLVEALGYTWEEVHDEAERLEHAISDLLVERMARAIGDPTVDPHGAPIPSIEGVMDERTLASLAATPIGATVRIARVADEDSAVLRELALLGIVPGIEVTVIQRHGMAGPLTLGLVTGEQHTMQHSLAEHVLVE